MKTTIFKKFHPYTTLLYEEGTLSELIPWLKDYPLDSEKMTAYLCQNYACHKPVHKAEELSALLT